LTMCAESKELFAEFINALERYRLANMEFVEAMKSGNKLSLDAALEKSGACQHSITEARIKLANHQRTHKCYGGRDPDSLGIELPLNPNPCLSV
jgi:hypothetical protein